MNLRKLRRDEQAFRRAMEKSFGAAFKDQWKAAGWGYLKPSAFKRLDDWFVDLSPMIWTDFEKAELNATIKPFALDELMSRILGFDGLEKSPLSLRARGPHSLVVPMWNQSIEAEGDIVRMLGLASIFTEDVSQRVSALTLDEFIDFLSVGRPVDQISYNEVAALILGNRQDEALSLCEQAISKKQWGGPARMTDDGQVLGFFDLSKMWIERSGLHQGRT